MASYLSYFTSNSSSAPNQQQYPQAQSTTSTWTGTFSSLRKALTKGSEEDDPDNEDCSHVSNVLRAYYTEKGRALPEWLPPDPKKPAPIPQAQPQSQYGQYGNAYGNQYGQPAPTHSRGSSGGGGLSDLWDSAPATRPTPQSLRAPRQQAQTSRGYDSSGRQGSADSYGPPQTQQTLSGRPSLPSQRSGSYQAAPPTSAPNKNDRLKARLQAGGSGRNSPASNASAQNPYSDAGYTSGQGFESGNTPYGSATQPWSNTGGYDNHPAGGAQYNRRPGGPR